MDAATEILKEKGLGEPFDVMLLVLSGIWPEVEALHKTQTCQADVEMQEALDKDAANISRGMEVFVVTGNEQKIPRRVAIDGSGETISGSGKYIEKVWKIVSRRFVKMHFVVDVVTHEILAIAVTMEKPGDAAMFSPIMKALCSVRNDIGMVYADSAYDTKANWKLMRELGI